MVAYIVCRNYEKEKFTLPFTPIPALHSPSISSDKLKMRGLVSIAIWLCASKLSLATTTFQDVVTENGKITGHAAPKAKNVMEYLGIPYAQPPIGDLRWAAPQKYTAKGPYVAANFVSAHLISCSC